MSIKDKTGQLPSSTGATNGGQRGFLGGKAGAGESWDCTAQRRDGSDMQVWPIALKMAWSPHFQRLPHKLLNKMSVCEKIYNATAKSDSVAVLKKDVYLGFQSDSIYEGSFFALEILNRELIELVPALNDSTARIATVLTHVSGKALAITCKTKSHLEAPIVNESPLTTYFSPN
jgi:hypothetical protein